MAGYSGTSLAGKLGIKAGQKAVFLQAPPEFLALLGDLPVDFKAGTKLVGAPDYIHFFTKQKAELERRFPNLVKRLAPGGMI